MNVTEQNQLGPFFDSYSVTLAASVSVYAANL